MSEKKYHIREAIADDAETILELVLALGKYEKLRGEVSATPADFKKHGFGPNPAFHCLLAEDEQGFPVAFALYFFKFSTFKGNRTLHLEDLFVRETHRGKGVGKALFMALATEADRLDCTRMEWDVLDWNQPAIDFYLALGAQQMTDWRTFRLDKEKLNSLVASRRMHDN